MLERLTHRCHTGILKDFYTTFQIHLGNLFLEVCNFLLFVSNNFI